MTFGQQVLGGPGGDMWLWVAGEIALSLNLLSLISGIPNGAPSTARSYS